MPLFSLLLRGNRESQTLHHLLDVYPHPLLFPRAAQEIGRMKSRHDRDAFIFLPDAAHLRDPLFCPEQVLRRHVAECHDDLGLDGLYLLFHEPNAGLDLIRLGIAVVRRAAFDDVADIDLCAFDLHALLYDVGQELACRADKGPALLVLLEPGAFTDENDRGLRVPFAIHDAVPAIMQLAPRAVADLLSNGLKRERAA